MPARYVTELRHALGDDGRPLREPREAALFFRALADYAAAAHFVAVGDDVRTALRCVARRGAGRCRSCVDVRRDERGETLWTCGECGVAGLINGFVGTPFDPRTGDGAVRAQRTTAIRVDVATLSRIRARAALGSIERIAALTASRVADGAVLRITDEERRALGLRAPALPATPRVRPAADVVAELFTRPPSTEADALARFEGIDAAERRAALLARARVGDVPLGAEDLWSFAYQSCGRSDAVAAAGTLVRDRSAAPRRRALALSALQTLDVSRAVEVMGGLENKDAATVCAEQLLGLARAIEEEPDFAEALAQAIGAVSGPGPLETLRAIERVRREERVPASVVYRALLADCRDVDVAAFVAARLIEEGAPGRRLAATARQSAKSPAVRAVIARALDAPVAPVSPVAPAQTGDAWLSASDGVGVVVALFALDRPSGGRILINIVFRLTRELRDGFVETNAHRGQVHEMMQMMVDGGAPPFVAAAPEVAARFLRDAAELARACGRPPTAELAKILARLEPVVSASLPPLPKPLRRAGAGAVLGLLDHREYTSWFFSPGDLKETGIDAATSITGSLDAIQNGSLRDRMLRMTEFMARWHALR